MILEGSYPFVHGGVSSWTHQYIQAMKEHDFILMCIGAEEKDKDKFKYTLPKNVIEVHQYFLDSALRLKPTNNKVKITDKIFNKKKDKMTDKMTEELVCLLEGEKTDWETFFVAFQENKVNPLSYLMSEAFLSAIKKVCIEKYPYMSFAEYFHTVRSMLLPELYLFMQEIPRADIYHATATGYSGLLASIGKWKYNSKFILTEHGIYTREREEELLRAKWVPTYFKKQWISLFYSFSACAYSYADKITSLYEGAAKIQSELGAEENRLQVIGNGIHYERFCDIPQKEENGYIDIGAVVRIAKIKDVKTMIYSFAELKIRVKNARLFILGDVDDKEYKEECENLIKQLKVEDIFFTGVVNVVEYIAKFDFTILTSISEGQPLSILESFAAGRPVVATDVGCCRELVYGNSGDEIGQAGYVVPPMQRDEVASAMERLCTNNELRIQMGENGRKRAGMYYTHEISINKYRALYKEVAENGRNRI